MERLLFRLTLVAVALLAVFAFVRPGADERGAPAIPADVPRGPLAGQSLPASEAEAKKAYEAARRAREDAESSARLTLRYEEETSPERLRPPSPPERSPARGKKQRFYRVVVKSAGTLKAEDTVIRLSGLSAPAAGDTCPAAAGAPWPCGRVGQAALSRLIRARAVECRFDGRDADGALLGRCTVAGTDINEWVVRMGWARTSADSAYAEALAAAKEDGSGLWGSSQAQP